jgi:hypothetical protein
MNYCGKNDFITQVTVHASFMGSVHSINIVIAIQTQLCWLWLMSFGSLNKKRTAQL